MKRYTYLVLAATLALSACSNGAKEKETTSAVVETQKAEEHMTLATEAVLETEAATEIPSDEEVEVTSFHTPLNIALTAEYEGEWNEKGPIITADSAKLLILDDGYENLKKAIDQYNKDTWQQVYEVYSENLEYTKEGIYPEGTSLSISREIELKRADSHVLSFINTETAFLGGAHGSYYENTVVFDTETGEKLELTDVVTDLDSVYKLVVAYLEENYEKEWFYEDYKDWLCEMFYEPESETSSPIEWILTMEGLEFRFSPYVLGPWASGSFEAKIPYADHEALFQEKYLSMVEHPIHMVEPETELLIDTNGDGLDERVWFTVEWDENTYNTTLTVNRNGKTEDDAEVNSSVSKDDIYGWYQRAYLMYAEDHVPYLYVEFGMENDWEKMEIVRLAETVETKDMEYIGGTRNAIYGHFVSDPRQFALYDRVDVLGTYMSFKKYSVGTDGMPVTEDAMYQIANAYFQWEHALTSKKDLNVMIHVDGSGEKKEEILPKGTKFRPCMTDGSSVIVMELEDGRRCDIQVEKHPNDYIYYVNGVSEYDLFENLPYAG